MFVLKFDLQLISYLSLSKITPVAQQIENSDSKEIKVAPQKNQKKKMEAPCHVCGTAASLMCSRCKAVRYCTQACQRVDWPAHKSICGSGGISTSGAANVSDTSSATLSVGLIGGMEFYSQAAEKHFKNAGFRVVKMTFKDLEEEQKLQQVQVVVLFQIGSGVIDETAEKTLLRGKFHALRKWVKDSGNTFVINGERRCADLLHSAFAKEWKFKGDFYRRCEFERQNDDDVSLPETYCVKACMLSYVDPADRVYCPAEGSMSLSLVPGFGASTEPNMCAIADSRCGSGRVIFFGDVNAEDETFIILAKLLKKKREKK